MTAPPRVDETPASSALSAVWAARVAAVKAGAGSPRAVDALRAAVGDTLGGAADDDTAPDELYGAAHRGDDVF